MCFNYAIIKEDKANFAGDATGISCELTVTEASFQGADNPWLSVLGKWEWQGGGWQGVVEGPAGHVLGLSFNLNVGQQSEPKALKETFLSVSSCVF